DPRDRLAEAALVGELRRVAAALGGSGRDGRVRPARHRSAVSLAVSGAEDRRTGARRLLQRPELLAELPGEDLEPRALVDAARDRLAHALAVELGDPGRRDPLVDVGSLERFLQAHLE